MSRDFTEMVEEHSKNWANQSKESKDAMIFLKQKMDAAQGFIDAVKQRQNTLMTTMQAIIDLQRPFFQMCIRDRYMAVADASLSISILLIF